jgi:hypothetical protein
MQNPIHGPGGDSIIAMPRKSKNQEIGAEIEKGSPPGDMGISSDMYGDLVFENTRWFTSCIAILRRDLHKSSDETDSMLFHWLGFGTFRELSLEDQRRRPYVRYNPLYWLMWFGTIVSLFTGLKFHGLAGQGQPVHDNETRVEYEARVHWVYTTTGGMIWVCIKCVCELLYYASKESQESHFFLGYILPEILSFVMALCLALGNVAFVRVMQLKSRSGVRSIIVCNVVFSVGLLTAVIFQSIHDGIHLQENSGFQQAYYVFALMAKFCCVFFYLLAACIYGRLWSLYESQSKNIRGRINEAAPAILAATGMVCLVVVGLKGHVSNTPLEQYVLSTFI